MDDPRLFLIVGQVSYLTPFLCSLLLTGNEKVMSSVVMPTGELPPRAIKAYSHIVI